MQNAIASSILSLSGTAETFDVAINLDSANAVEKVAQALIERGCEVEIIKGRILRITPKVKAPTQTR
jgi:hypothetical protein